VYSEGSYGEYGIEVFTREATERNVCIAAALKVPSAANDKVFDDIIQRLSKKPNARAIVLFTRAEDARGILEAARRSNLSQPFQVGGREASNYCRVLTDNMEPAVISGLLIIDDYHFSKRFKILDQIKSPQHCFIYIFYYVYIFLNIINGNDILEANDRPIFY